jgi:hypothetical protein
MQKVYNDKTLGIATYDFVKPADANIETNCQQADSLNFIVPDSSSFEPDSAMYYPGMNTELDEVR